MFKNVTLFSIASSDWQLPDELEKHFSNHLLRECGPLELETCGFVPLIAGESTALTHTIGSFTAFAVGWHKKLIPTDVLNAEVAKRVNKIAQEEGRRVGGHERKRIKDDVSTELLARAFVKSSRVDAYIDRRRGLLVVDAASAKVAEAVVSKVREALGSFPAVPVASGREPRHCMTQWLAVAQAPASFTFGDECELRDFADPKGRIWRARRQELTADEVQEHLRAGLQASKLGLVFDNACSFVLGDDLVLRKTTLLDVDDESLEELGVDDQATIFDSQFSLMTLTLDRVFDALNGPLELFGA